MTDRPSAPISILLVEDHPDTLTVTAKMIRARGFAVTTATNCAEAISQASKVTIDFAVIDVGLPDGTGYELMAELSRRFGLNGIALTGHGSNADQTKASEAGFMDHFLKPMTTQALDELLAVVRSVVSR